MFHTPSRSVVRTVIGVESLTAWHYHDLVCKSEPTAAVPPGATEWIVGDERMASKGRRQRALEVVHKRQPQATGAMQLANETDPRSPGCWRGRQVGEVPRGALQQAHDLHGLVRTDDEPPLAESVAELPVQLPSSRLELLGREVPYARAGYRKTDRTNPTARRAPPLV